MKKTLDKAFELSSLSKASKLIPADIIKAQAAVKGERINYMTTWRKITMMSSSKKEALTKSYELVVPYLCRLLEMNPSSTVNYEVDDNKCLLQFSSVLAESMTSFAPSDLLSVLIVLI